jgi:hypothetical protein
MSDWVVGYIMGMAVGIAAGFAIGFAAGKKQKTWSELLEQGKKLRKLLIGRESLLWFWALFCITCIRALVSSLKGIASPLSSGYSDLTCRILPRSQLQSDSQTPAAFFDFT